MREKEKRRMERKKRIINKMDVQSELKDRCKSEELRKRLDIEDVADVVRKSRLGWFGHLERNSEKGCGKLGISMQKYGYCRKCWKRQTEKEVE